jgi:monovalent cation:H+ antiporter, CPA1 family
LKEDRQPQAGAMVWNPLEEIALLIGVTAAFAYFNHYLLRLPKNVGLLVLALAASLGLRIVAYFFPALPLSQLVGQALDRVDFAPLLLNGMLAFLLFAGAVEMDVASLVQRKWTILALATVGVLLSTLMVGFGMWFVFALVGLPIPLFYCVAFGALISPTDPVTVMDVLQRAPIGEGLRALIAGEAMFNDGIGIVLYSLFLEAALAGASPGAATWVIEFCRAAGGGAVLGLVTGFLAFVAMRGIDEYGIELMISLTLVAGTYGIAEAIGVSGPVAVVIAGLIMGSIGVRYAVSDTTHEYLGKFWSLIDQLLNALLYFLVGLEFATVAIDGRLAIAALFAILLVLAGRALSIAIPGVPLNLHAEHKLKGIAVMSWSGLRGGISLALALSIPVGEVRTPLITVTYAVVIFTMLVQGLSLGSVARRLYPAPR